MALSEGTLRRKKQLRSTDNPVVLCYSKEFKYKHITFLSTYINEDDTVITRCNDVNVSENTNFTEYNNLTSALRQDSAICIDCIMSMYNLWSR